MHNKQLLSAVKQIVKSSKVDDAVNVLALAVLELDAQQTQINATLQKLFDSRRKSDPNSQSE